MTAGVSAIDVFDYLATRGVTAPWSVQKVLFYCQVWSLVWDKEPLFPEDFQAWRDGPVCVRVRNSTLGGDGGKLSAAQRETVDAVIGLYGQKTSKWLIELTHRERPWIDARGGAAPNERTNAVMPNDALVSYYSGYGVKEKAFSPQFEEALELLVASPEGLSPLPDDVYVDAEPFMRWLESGEGDPWARSSA